MDTEQGQKARTHYIHTSPSWLVYFGLPKKGTQVVAVASADNDLIRRSLPRSAAQRSTAEAPPPAPPPAYLPPSGTPSLPALVGWGARPARGGRGGRRRGRAVATGRSPGQQRDGGDAV